MSDAADQPPRELFENYVERMSEIVNGSGVKIIRVDEYTAMVTHLQTAREENVKLRNKLLQLAKECASCHGTGRVNVPKVLTDVLGQHTSPCGDCADIRDVLK